MICIIILFPGDRGGVCKVREEAGDGLRAGAESAGQTCCWRWRWRWPDCGGENRGAPGQVRRHRTGVRLAPHSCCWDSQSQSNVRHTNCISLPITISPFPANQYSGLKYPHCLKYISVIKIFSSPEAHITQCSAVVWGWEAARRVEAVQSCLLGLLGLTDNLHVNLTMQPVLIWVFGQSAWLFTLLFCKHNQLYLHCLLL